MKVEMLIEFATGIQFIGNSYKEDEKDLQGEPWAVKPKILSDQIGQQLGLNDLYSEYKNNGLNELFEIGQFKMGIKPVRWTVLCELTNDFSNTVYSHMHVADKKLREVATDLHLLTMSVFGRNYENF